MSGSNLQPSEAQGITFCKVLIIPKRKFPFKQIYLYKKVGHNLPPSNAMLFVFFHKVWRLPWRTSQEFYSQASATRTFKASCSLKTFISTRRCLPSKRKTQQLGQLGIKPFRSTQVWDLYLVSTWFSNTFFLFKKHPRSDIQGEVQRDSGMQII